MTLGPAPLGFVALPAGDLVEDVLARLGDHSSTVLEVVQLRLHSIDVALSLDFPDLLVDQRDWESVRLTGEGSRLSPADVDRAVLHALADHLDAATLARVDRLHGLTRDVRGHGRAPESTEDPAQTVLAREYLVLALAGRRDDAIRVVHAARQGGMDAVEVMLSILQPAQLELGRMWASGEISIAHEHYVTGLTRVCMSMLYPVVPAQRSPDAPRLVSLTTGSETHELGMKMVSDLMQHEGWNVAFLGTDLPNRDVVSFVAATRPDVVAVSVTMSAHVMGVHELISELRAEPGCSGIKVLVGGRPFSLNPALQGLVDADGWAPGPREALALCQLWRQRDVAARRADLR